MDRKHKAEGKRQKTRRKKPKDGDVQQINTFLILQLLFHHQWKKKKKFCPVQLCFPVGPLYMLYIGLYCMLGGLTRPKRPAAPSTWDAASSQAAALTLTFQQCFILKIVPSPFDMRSALTHNDMIILVNQFLFDEKSAVAVRGGGRRLIRSRYKRGSSSIVFSEWTSW